LWRRLLYDLQLTNGPPTQKEKHDFWVEIYKDAALVPEDTFSDRIKVCYRLTRALAYWKGIVTDDQTLEEGCHIEPSPWNTPVTCVSNFAPDGHRHGMVQAQTTPLPLSPPEAEDGLQQWLKIMGRIAGRLGVAVSESGRRARPRGLRGADRGESQIRPHSQGGPSLRRPGSAGSS
jgi:hypothetical protein